MTRNKTETQDLSLAYYKFSDIVLVYVGNKNILSSNAKNEKTKLQVYIIYIYCWNIEQTEDYKYQQVYIIYILLEYRIDSRL